jgi:hypothetical protein
MRNLILKGFPQDVDYITEQPQQFPVRIEAEQRGGMPAIDVVGALHGELQPLVPLDALVPLDDLSGKLTGRGIPDALGDRHRPAEFVNLRDMRRDRRIIGPRVTDYKSGKPPRNGSEPVLRGGAELQRCLYAFAVRSLLPVVNSVSSRLLYPKAADDGLYSLADPDDVLFGLAEFAAAAARLAAAGNLLPGPGAANIYNDFAFALPGGAKESYFELKSPLIAAHLADLAPLWEMQ